MLQKLTKLYNQSVEVLELHDLHALLLKLSILLVGFFAPLQEMLFSLLFLVLVDLITGVIAAYKKKQKITSSKLSRTIAKILVYLTTVTVVHVANDFILFGADFIPLETFVVGFIAITEVKSIFENLNRISKHKFLTDLIRKLSNDARKKGADRRK